MTQTDNMMHLTVATPEGVVYDSAVTQATIPTGDGEITVLRNHTPLVSSLASGEMIVVKEGEEHYFAVSGGILEVREGGKVILLADSSERAEDIDIERAEEARKRAEEALQAKDSLAREDYARFQALLDRELTRINVARRRRR